MDSDVKTGIMKTKYPVVLVHGAGIRDTFFLRSFGKIDKELRKLGYDVTVADTDGNDLLCHPPVDPSDEPHMFFKYRITPTSD